MKRILRESFVPMLLVIAGLFLGLVGVRLFAVVDADRVSVIEIPAQPIDDGSDFDEDAADGLADYVSEVSHDRRVADAERLASAGHYDDAIKQYREAIAQQPDPGLQSELAMLYYRKGDSESALQTLDATIADHPTYSRARYNRGFVLSSITRYKAAISDYQAVLRINPHHFEALYNSGLAYMGLGDYAAASNAFADAAESAGGSHKAKALYNLGVANTKRGNDYKDGAKTAFERAIRLQPDYIKARYQLAKLLSDTPPGRAKAIQELEKILRLDPNFAPAHYRMAVLLREQGKTAQAREALSKTVAHDPDNLKARFRLGVLLLTDRKWGEALQQFEFITQRQPKDATAQFYVGRCAYGMRDYDRSIAAYREAIRIRGGDYPEAYLNIGLVFSTRKELPKAISNYRKALEGNKNYPRAWYDLGIAYMKLHDGDNAIASFRRALDFDPSYTEAWFNLGVLYARAGRDDDAIGAYKAAVSLRPNYKEAQLNLAVRHAKRGEYNEAIALYRDVLAADDSYAKAWLNLGLAYTAASDPEGAEQAFRKASELEPSDSKPRRLLAELLIANGRDEESVALYADLVDAEPDNIKLRLGYAMALRAAGQNAEARQEFEKARRLDPKDPQVVSIYSSLKTNP